MKKSIKYLIILIITGVYINASAQNLTDCKDFQKIILESAKDFDNSKKNPVTDSKGNITYETTLPTLGLNPHIKTEVSYNIITEINEKKHQYSSSKVFFEEEYTAQKVFDDIVNSIKTCFSKEPKISNFMGIKTNLFEVEYQGHPAILDISILHLSKDKKSVVTISIKKKD